MHCVSQVNTSMGSTTHQDASTAAQPIHGEDNTINYIAILDTGNGFITAGAATESYATQLSYVLLQHMQPIATARLVTAVTTITDSDVYAIPEDYLSAFKNPVDDGRKHVLRGFTTDPCPSLVDWYTFLPAETRTEIRRHLAASILEVETQDLETYRDIVDAVHRHYPQLGSHGVFQLVKDIIWPQVKSAVEEERFTAVKQPCATPHIS